MAAGKIEKHVHEQALRQETPVRASPGTNRNFATTPKRIPSMPSPKTVSVRDFNRQVKLVAVLRGELETTQEGLVLEKNKSRKLRKRLKDARAPGLEELSDVRDQCKKESDSKLIKIKREYDEKIEELLKIQDKFKRDDEHLRLASKHKVKIPGNLEKIEEHSNDKHRHFVSGGTGGAI